MSENESGLLYEGWVNSSVTPKKQKKDKDTKKQHKKKQKEPFGFYQRRHKEK